jgi:hypothetical protein
MARVRREPRNRAGLAGERAGVNHGTSCYKGNKRHLPSKDCAACGRPMTWRRRWKRNWDQVKYCSDACRRHTPAPAATTAATLLLAAAVLAPDGVRAEDTRAPTLTVELGAAWQARNDARVSNERPNTRFAIDDITGSGPYAAGRIALEWPFAERHVVRVLAAPLSIDETGTSDRTIVFRETVFNPGQVRAEYRFDSWRLGYRYVFHDSGQWTWSGGATLNIRDAEIRLSQGSTRRSRTDTGLVPLLALVGEWRFAPDWRALLDIEGLGAPQGRAIDATLQVGYDLTPALHLSGGYRVLDGGADNDDIYTFARFDFAVLALSWRFR